MTITSTEFHINDVKLLEEPPITEINSGCFFSYLDGQFPEVYNFADRLELPEFGEIYTVLGNEKQLVYRYPERMRSLLRASNPDLAELQVPSERISTLYKDLSTNQCHWMPVDTDSGEFTTTRRQVLEILEGGGRPLIEFHTHPLDSLPSPSDYFFMVWDIGDPTARCMRAISVLCPNIRILAITTPSTARISPEEYNEYDQQFKARITGGRLTELSEIRRRRLQELEDYLYELVKDLNPDEMTEEKKEKITILRDQKLKELRLLEIQQEFLRVANFVTNASLLQVARDWGILLYTTKGPSGTDFIKMS